MSKRILFASIKKRWVLQKLSKFPKVLELMVELQLESRQEILTSMLWPSLETPFSTNIKKIYLTTYPNNY